MERLHRLRKLIGRACPSWRSGPLGRKLSAVASCVAGFSALVFLTGCNRSELGRCAEIDRSCISKAFTEHRVRNASFWADEMAKPRSARLGPAPAALLDYLTLGNVMDGFRERPRAAALDAAFMADVQTALDEIPADVRQLAESRLVGIYFVEQLGGTGYTDYVRDQDGKPSHAYVVLDATVLSALRANSWATWKENTPFRTGPQTSDTLTATIADPSDNDRKGAIRYILLHELAHVISVGRKVHPIWGGAIAQPAPGEYPFFDLSWKVNASKTAYESSFDAGWPRRKDVVYYLGAKQTANDMVSTYQALAKTNFSTLYAATGPGDDFAESLVSYLHTVRMGRPWNITIRRGADVVQTLESCWAEERCAPKRKILEAILAGN